MFRRRKLSLRTPGNSLSNRLKAICKKIVENFFKNMVKVFDEHSYHAPHIWNMDEMPFIDCSLQFNKASLFEIF